jgi:hypothetical protein
LTDEKGNGVVVSEVIAVRVKVVAAELSSRSPEDEDRFFVREFLSFDKEDV